MIYMNHNPIGILTCPGGAAFSERIIRELESTAEKNFWRKVNALAAKYSLPREEIVKRINLSIDLRHSTLNLEQPVDRFNTTSFSIPAIFTRFANGEFKTEILTTVRNMDVYIIQDVENHHALPFNARKDDLHVLSVNDHIFCLIATIDSALQAGARKVTVVLPTYPYSRQHEKKRREGLTAARFGQILEYLGVERIITLDIHSKEIENCFNRLRLENLYASYQILKVLATIIDLNTPELVIFSPDTGSVERNKFYASSLHKPFGMMYKERDYSRISESAKQDNITSIRLLGSVEGKTVFMADDMLGTGATILKALKTLKDLGAARIICAVSLPYFTGSAIQDFEEAYRAGLFYRFIGTNAIYHGTELLGREWYLCADVAKLFAKSIYRLHFNRSLSPLMDNRKIIQDMLEKQQEAEEKK